MPIFHYYIAATTINEVGISVSIFMLFSLIIDIYKKYCMYLASSNDHISPESFRKKKKILTYVMIAMQLSFAIFQIVLIVGV